MTLLMRTVLSVPADQTDEFSTVAAEWVARTQDEVGVEFFAITIQPEAAQGTFLEIYADADAFRAHAAQVDPDLRRRLYSFAQLLSYDVYGDVPDDVRSMLAGANPTYHRVAALRASTPAPGA